MCRRVLQHTFQHFWLSCFYVRQRWEGDAAYTDQNRKLLLTVKLEQLSTLSNITVFPSSPMKMEVSLSHQLVSSKKMWGNAGKTHSSPLPSSELPSPRTNNRRISVFTGIMTQSALRLAASSDRKFYLAMG